MFFNLDLCEFDYLALLYPPPFFFSILFRQSLGGIVKGFIFFFLTCFLTILCFYKNS